MDNMRHLCNGLTDWADLGASSGDGLLWIREWFNVTAVGLDIDPSKVRLCKERGLKCVQADVAHLTRVGKCFKIVSMLHVLEHLPTRHTGRRVFRLATSLASDMVIFRGPLWSTRAFEGTGLGFYFTNWSGHRSLFDLQDILAAIHGAKESWIILQAFAVGRVTDSDDYSIVPVKRAARNAPRYRSFFGPKPDPPIKFQPPLFRELFVILRKENLPDQQFATYLLERLERYKSYLQRQKGTANLAHYNFTTQELQFSAQFHGHMLEQVKLRRTQPFRGD